LPTEPRNAASLGGGCASTKLALSDVYVNASDRRRLLVAGQPVLQVAVFSVVETSSALLLARLWHWIRAAADADMAC
jgi:hypothetical protein